ncbi:MAG: hypothetical protein DRQ88_12885 [Epsilonproteobacteria bacterium]|nr:MAG: hypothetical protein DRQ88_12885 [Campylobacterota bacterium]
MKLKVLILMLLVFSSSTFAQKITANWMGRLYGEHSDTKLRAILIPGTHDSATYAINKKSPFPKDAPKFFKIAKKTVAIMSKTQNEDIYEQLLRGNRYLDLRITDYNNKLYIVHGMISIDLETVLKDIRRFSELYPREVIFVDFQKMPKPVYYPQLHQLVQKYLGNLMYFRDIKPKDLRFHHLWRKRKNILSIMNSSKFTKSYQGYFNRDDFLISNWANTTVKSTLKSKLKKSLEDQNLNKFHVGSLTLTPDTKYIIKGIFLKKKYNIYRLSEQVFNSPGEWLPQWRKKGVKMNIISVDFEEESNLMGTVLRLNKEALRLL